MIVKPQTGLFERFKRFFFFRVARSLPVIGRKIQEDLDKAKDSIPKGLFSLSPGDVYNTHLPDKGMTCDAVLAIAQSKYKSMEKIDWQGGRASGAVYDYRGEEHRELMAKIFSLFVADNPLHPDVFPGTRKMEAEVVAMCCNFFHGGPDTCGTMTSGGTESILMACKAYRERAYKRGIKTPEILACRSAHPAFSKAARYLAMRYILVAVDPQTMQMNLKELRKKINKNTCMLVASAPSFPYGVIDQVEDIGQIGKLYNIPVHVDACMGGFIIPFAKQAGLDLPSIDFAVEGVTSISVDAHKYGTTPKGSSLILYSYSKYRVEQFFVNTDWCGGIYGSSAAGGSRSGAIIATCWATMMTVGLDGYMDNAVKVIQTREYIEKHVLNIPGLCVYGRPNVNIVSIGSQRFDINCLGSALKGRGWHLHILQYPSGLHFAVTNMHTAPGVAYFFLKDLRECTAEMMKDPNAKPEGLAAMYGMAMSIPDRSVVEEFAHNYLDAYYNTQN